MIFLISHNQGIGQVGQGGEDGLVWPGLCEKDSQDDFDSERKGSVGPLMINMAIWHIHLDSRDESK